jgi:tetratricopeptide (TPR) repeat protein
MLGHYLHAGLDAARVLDPARLPAAEPAGPDASKEPVVDGHQALTWFDAEHPVLLAAIAQGAREGFDDYARQIAGTLEPFFTRRGNWRDLALTQRTALDCSDRLGDPAGQALAHLHLGRALSGLGQTEAARTHLARAAQLYAAAGNRAEQARAHLGLSMLCQGDMTEAIASCLRALQLAEADADIPLMAYACNNLGYDYAVLGDTGRALAYCRRGLDLCQQADVDPCLEGHLEDSLGYVYRRLGDQREAVVHYRRAVRTFRAAGAPQFAACSLSDLGECQANAGNAEAAADAWQRALSILGDLDHPDASRIRGKIGALREVSRNGSADGGLEPAASAAEPALPSLR